MQFTFNMLLAMGIAAFICIFLGVYPAPLYHILPFPVTYQPYTIFHVIGMLELLMFGALAFAILILSGFYPSELRAVNLDTDWFFRMPGRAFIKFCDHPLKTMGDFLGSHVSKLVAWACLAPHGALKIEERFDKIFHKTLTAFPSVIFIWMKPLKTETRQISWNVLCILLPFVFILFFILILRG